MYTSLTATCHMLAFSRSNHIHHAPSTPSPTPRNHIYAPYRVSPLTSHSISHTWTHRFWSQLISLAGRSRGRAALIRGIRGILIPTPHPLPHFSSFPLSSPPLTVSSPSTFDDAMNLHITPISTSSYQSHPSQPSYDWRILTSRPHIPLSPAYLAPAQPSYASNSRDPPYLLLTVRVVLGGVRAGAVFGRARC
jgi:hypothetical protein